MEVRHAAVLGRPTAGWDGLFGVGGGGRCILRRRERHLGDLGCALCDFVYDRCGGCGCKSMRFTSPWGAPSSGRMSRGGCRCPVFALRIRCCVE